ncbi:MAG: DUF488 domain-containing protein [Elusimicrobia bacterium]|nr:DUF488 domain-containing protein [Elusimicrobiota bacterium]
MTKPIYTIGYGNRSVEQLIALLRMFNISFLVDVRSKPFSSFKPEFSQMPLSHALSDAGIKYLFMGNSLGGQPGDPFLLTNGKVDYSKLRQSSAFRAGLDRVKMDLQKGCVMVLMCSEGKPEECHRSKLIGEALSEDGLEVLHINELGKPMKHDDVIQKLTGGQQDFFGHVFTSRNRHVPS